MIGALLRFAARKAALMTAGELGQPASSVIRL
jgi:hypothetical protein